MYSRKVEYVPEYIISGDENGGEREYRSLGLNRAV